MASGDDASHAPDRFRPDQMRREAAHRDRAGLRGGQGLLAHPRQACCDAEDRPLRTAFEKSFRIVPADRLGPDPARWTLTATTAENRAPLVAALGEPLDHALARRMVRVKRADGPELDGAVMPRGAGGDVEFRSGPSLARGWAPPRGAHDD